jgi:hypothetical protein
MSAFDNAQRFFVACETAKGWEGCAEYVADDAAFVAQCEPIADIARVEDYCEWMKALGTITAPDASYDLHSASYDEANRTAVFFATFHGTHTGDGGPVPPTGKSTATDYVYALRIDGDDKVTHMTKIWNAPWALRELGWSE